MHSPLLPCAGVRIADSGARAALSDLLQRHGLDQAVQIQLQPDADGRTGLVLALDAAHAARWTPAHDTLDLAHQLGLDTRRDEDLDREILVAMLAAPVPLAFDSADELLSSLRVRRHIARAAARTELNFDTEMTERPAEDWVYDEAHGFLLRPGRELIDALVRATQPAPAGERYAVSCYRASEYVILLGIAQELRAVNPALLERLTQQCRHDAIRSARFHDCFLVELGSMQAPLPPLYLVPGDRLWFRNPEPVSADITGYEGSWVIYLGGGLFSNFWQRDRPYTLRAKALEIYHWRDGVVGPADAPQVDEAVVARHVAATLEDPAACERILERMLRLRDPKGEYLEGGCLDTTREYPRQLRPGTADLRLP